MRSGDCRVKRLPDRNQNGVDNMKNMVINNHIIVFNNYGINDFFRYMLLNNDVNKNINRIMEYFDFFNEYDNKCMDNVFISFDTTLIVYDTINDELSKHTINNDNKICLLDVYNCYDYMDLINTIKRDFNIDITYHMLYLNCNK